MKQLLFSLLFITALSPSLLAQKPGIITFTADTGEAYGEDVLILDNGHRVVMYNTNNPLYQCFIVGFDSTLTQQWSRYLGDNASSSAFVQTGANSFIVYINHSIDSVTIASFDAAGNKLWYHTSEDLYSVTNMVLLPSGKLGVLFRDLSPFPVIGVLNSNGTFDWTKRIDITDLNSIYTVDLVLAPNDDLIAVLKSFEKMRITRVSPTGNLVSNHGSSLPTVHKEMFRNCVLASNNKLYCTGYSDTNIAEPKLDDLDIVVREFNLDATSTNSRRIGHRHLDWGNKIINTHDDQLAIIGLSLPIPNCDGNAIVVKLDTALDTIYTRVYGDNGGNGAIYDNLHEGGTGYYSFGWGSNWSTGTEEQSHLLEFDSLLRLPCARQFYKIKTGKLGDAESVSTQATLESVSIDLNDRSSVSGPVMYAEVYCRGYLPDPYVPPVEDSTVSIKEFDALGLQLYPNPAHDVITLSGEQLSSGGFLSIYASDGRLIGMERIASTTSHELNVETLDTGMYIMVFDNGRDVFRQRVMIEQR